MADKQTTIAAAVKARQAYRKKVRACFKWWSIDEIEKELAEVREILNDLEENANEKRLNQEAKKDLKFNDKIRASMFNANLRDPQTRMNEMPALTGSGSNESDRE